MAEARKMLEQGQNGTALAQQQQIMASNKAVAAVLAELADQPEALQAFLSDGALVQKVMDKTITLSQALAQVGADISEQAADAGDEAVSNNDIELPWNDNQQSLDDLMETLKDVNPEAHTILSQDSALQAGVLSGDVTFNELLDELRARLEGVGGSSGSDQENLQARCEGRQPASASLAEVCWKDVDVDCTSYDDVFGPAKFPGTANSIEFIQPNGTYTAMEFNTSDMQAVSGRWVFEIAQFEAGGIGPKLMSISKCPGDFDQDAIEEEMGPNCYKRANGIRSNLLWKLPGVSDPGAYKCELDLDTTYYLNIMYTTAPEGTDPADLTWDCAGNDETRNCANLMVPAFTPGTPPETQEACVMNWADQRTPETVPHGSSIKAFESHKVLAGQSCNSQKRTCNDGELSGKFRFKHCAPIGNDRKQDCVMNWADQRTPETVPHGSSIEAFESHKVLAGQSCNSQKRTCNDGELSGKFRFKHCAPIGNDRKQDCVMNWADQRTPETVPHGSSIEAFEDHSVPAGQSCNNQKRTCNDGELSGKFRFKHCAPVSQSGSCVLDGVTLADGESRKFFLVPQVGCGESCRSFMQTRTCNDGRLSGSPSFTNAKCEGQGSYACAQPRPVECTQQVPPECECGGGFVPVNGECVASCLPCSVQ